MKIILSRKGFDSKYGGVPSPIIDERPFSFPIPTKQPSSIKFGDISSKHCQLIEEITKKNISKQQACHLDPDIDSTAINRLPNWRGALGQVGAASSHLQNQNVGVGDLFLFFGWFRKLEISPRIRFIGPSEHRIFGWLQISEIVDLTSSKVNILNRYPWLRDHPHVRDDWKDKKQNLLFIANEHLELPNVRNVKGYGVFSKGYKLSNEMGPKSLWKVPEWLNPLNGGTGISCHERPSRWTHDNHLQSVAIGQEFVADIGDRTDATDWLAQLFSEESYA